MRRRRHAFLRAKSALLLVLMFSLPILANALTQPLNACTMYKPRLLGHFESCAEFSVERGRHGCRKIKGTCPSCVQYPGDDVQMWLPDYLIEVTRHLGQSKFAVSTDSALLRAQLAQALATWQAGIVAPPTFGSNGDQSSSAGASFWHARILSVPYGTEILNYPPMSPSIGGGLPMCYAAISEFMPSQWNYNVADAPYALAWAPLGASMCLNILGGALAAGVAAAKKSVAKIAASAPRVNWPISTCATPVLAKEAFVKNALLSADTLTPLQDISKLCMGSWGPLVPRTGWVLSDDPFMSAMAAAYKFQSLAGDMHLNAALKVQDDDKWQIIYPPRAAGGCFRPGMPTVGATHGGDAVVSRMRDELQASDPGRGQTYVIAVWRRRHSCEEPLQSLGAWTANYQLQTQKNRGLCQAIYAE